MAGLGSVALRGSSRPGARSPAADGAALIGLEHEYYLWSGDARVDFRQLIHELPLDGRRIDPADASAYRLRSGLALTADEIEAEIASPPEPLVPGFSGRIESWGECGLAVLRSALPAGITAEGASTHISVSVDDRRATAAAELFTRRFAPGYMLLSERSDSFGIMVRPRNGRLELCSEYASGPLLRAVSAFAAGAALACARAAATGDTSLLPPPIEVRLQPCRDRAGVVVRRGAFGPDLYAEGRRAFLRLPNGQSIQAGEHLALSWASAREALNRFDLSADADEVEAIVRGARPLGVEPADVVPAEPAPFSDRVARSDVSWLLDVHERPGFCVRTEMATWDFAVFAVESLDRRLYLCVPRAKQTTFFARLTAGALDSELLARLRGRPRGRVLGSHTQTREIGLFDQLGRSAALLAPERGDPRRASTREAGVSEEFYDAMVVATPLTKVPPIDGGGIPWWLWPLILILILIGGGLITTSALRGGAPDEPSTGGETPTDGGGVVVTPTDTRPSGTSGETPVASGSPTTGTGGSPTTGTGGSPTTGAGNSPTTGTGISPTTGTGESPTTGTGDIVTPSPTSTSAVVVTPPPTATSAAVATPTNTSLPVVLSGNRTTTFVVSVNPGNHPCALGTREVNFLIQRAGPPENGTPITITVTIAGTATLSGNTTFGPGFNSQGGAASANGTGQYCGFTTSFEMTFTISPSGISGTLVIGGNGSLPGGQPITFNFSGGSPH